MKRKKLLIVSISLIVISFIICTLSVLAWFILKRQDKIENPFPQVKQEFANIKNQKIEKETFIQKISLDDDTSGEIVLEETIKENIIESAENKELISTFNYSETENQNENNCELYVYDKQEYSKCNESEWFSANSEELLNTIEELKVSHLSTKYNNYFTFRKNLINILSTEFEKTEWRKSINETDYIFETSQEDLIKKVLGISSIDELLQNSKQEIDPNSVEMEMKISINDKNQIKSMEIKVSYIFEEKDYNYNLHKYKINIKSNTKFQEINNTTVAISYDDISQKIDPKNKLVQAVKKHKEIDNLTLEISSESRSESNSTYGNETFSGVDIGTVKEIHKVNLKDKIALITYDYNATLDMDSPWQEIYTSNETIYRYNEKCYVDSPDLESCFDIYYNANENLWYNWSYFSDIISLINESSEISTSFVKYVGNETINDELFFTYEVNIKDLDILNSASWNSEVSGTAKIWLSDKTGYIYKIETNSKETDSDTYDYDGIEYTYNTVSTQKVTYIIKDINITEINFPDDVREELKKE